MKKGWLAIGLLAGMVILSLWHVSALSGLTGSLGEQLEQAEALAERGDWERAIQVTQKASEEWDGRAFYLHVTLDHKTADDIAVGFAETLQFLEWQESGAYSAANARLMEQLKLLGEVERPNLENLL